MNDPETLLTYASIFEKPRREFKGGPLNPPSEICLAAAKALRFYARCVQAGDKIRRPDDALTLGEK